MCVTGYNQSLTDSHLGITFCSPEQHVGTHTLESAAVLSVASRTVWYAAERWMRAQPPIDWGQHRGFLLAVSTSECKGCHLGSTHLQLGHDCSQSLTVLTGSLGFVGRLSATADLRRGAVPQLPGQSCPMRTSPALSDSCQAAAAGVHSSGKDTPEHCLH